MTIEASCVTCQNATTHEVRWSNPRRERKFAACQTCGTTQPHAD